MIYVNNVNKLNSENRLSLQVLGNDEKTQTTNNKHLHH